MKGKKIFVSLISILFAFLMALLSFFAFTLKSVNAVYSAGENTSEYIDTTLKEKLNKVCGQNLLLLDLQTVKNIVEENPYLEVVSIEKQLPNDINVEVKELKEVYYLDYNNKTYVLAEDGKVLSEVAFGTRDRMHIALNVGNLTISSIQLGKKIVTNNNEVLSLAFSLAKNAALTNCIKNMEILTYIDFSAENGAKIQANVVFDTYTGVQIKIVEIFKHGEGKTEVAFAFYNAIIESTDYYKTFKIISVILQDDGVLVPFWDSSVGE